MTTTNIKLKETFTGNYVPFEVIHFPAGELCVKLEDPTLTNYFYTIEWNYKSDLDLSIIEHLVDVVTTYLTNKDIWLHVPYLPNSRMDRRSIEGGSFGLSLFAKRINSLEFGLVSTVDAHSEVHIIDNLQNASQKDCLASFLRGTDIDLSKYIIISPDKGAQKKIIPIIEYFKPVEFLKGGKTRNPDTGKITNFTLEHTSLLVNPDTPIIVIDDICDGGGTFIGIAKEIRKQFPHNKLTLYTTHGIYSQGMYKLLNFYDNVFCYNKFTKDYHEQH